MMEPPDAQEAEAEIEAGTAAARRIGADIAGRREQHYRPRGLGPFLLAAIGVIFRVFGRRLLGQFYAADARCTTCRLCERTCPVAAISIAAGAHARPGWNSRCESCNRCINICPEGAIVTSPGRMILVPASVAVIAYLLFRLLDSWFLPEAGLLRIGAIVVIILVSHGLYFLFPAPLYRLLYRVPGVRMVMSAGFNRRWRRYRFPEFRPPRHR